MESHFASEPIHAENSPSDEPLPTRLPPPSVTRINRRALVAAGVVATVIGTMVLVIGLSDNRGKGKHASGDSNPARPAEEFIGEQVCDLPKDYSFDVRIAAGDISYLYSRGSSADLSAPVIVTSSLAATRPAGPNLTLEQLACLDEQKRLADARRLFAEQQRKELQQAMDSPVIFCTIKSERSSPSAVSASGGQSGILASEEIPLNSAVSNHAVGDSGILPLGADHKNDQSEKEAFMDKAAAIEPYLHKPLIASVSKYELKAGSVIAGALITGINTDLPGHIIGQVTQNVYDSVTGDYLLIPQGSRLLGKYQSAISNGQNRVLVAWQRLIYPNGQSIVLEACPAPTRPDSQV